MKHIFYIQILWNKVRALRNQEGGAAMMIAVMFFIVVSTMVVLGLTAPAAREIRVASDTLLSKQSYFLAESGVEDVYYRLKNNKQTSASETLVLGSSSVVTTVADLGNGAKQIIGSGDVKNRDRTVSMSVTTAAGVTFNYGMQAGEGGITLSGSSGINGNVYSNGNITGSGSPFITGSAFAANSAALTADQSNGTGTPAQNITFANATGTQDIAQSFAVSTDGPLNKVSFYIKKVGSPSNATVKIVADNSGVPGTTVYASATLSASLVTTSYGWLEVPLTNILLTSGTTYWVVIDASSNSSKYYVVGGNANSYAGGTAKIGRFSSTWTDTSPSGLDLFFKVYIGGLTSTITGSYARGFRIGTSGVGDASAYTVNNANVEGKLYCQDGTGNNKACDTSQSVPAPASYPISDANIAQWEQDAAAGGTITGDYSVGGATTVSLGPKKIDGNLIVGNSGILKITGTVYVTGYIQVSGAAKVLLDSGTYGNKSGVLISDGYLSLAGSGQLNGTGQTGSYILFVTNSTCPIGPNCGGRNAIDISGAAGSVILNAQQGTITFSGSASAKEATAYQLSLSGSTTVTYESGLADLNFSTGPSGSYGINSWKETQ